MSETAHKDLHATTMKVKPNSRQRLREVRLQQQYLSETLKIDNFYQNQKLDISSLKDKIGELKRRPDLLKQNPQDSQFEKPIQLPMKTIALVPLSNRIQKLYKSSKISENTASRTIRSRQSRQALQSSKNQRNSTFFSNRNGKSQSNKQERLYDIGIETKHRDMRETRYQSRLEEHDQQLSQNFRSTIIPKIQNIGRRQSLTNGKSQKSDILRKMLNSSRLQPLSNVKRNLIMLKVETEDQLSEFEINVSTLWRMYQTLSSIINWLSYDNQTLLTNPDMCSKFVEALCAYRDIVCSPRLQFLVHIVDNCLEFTHAKTIILARLLENLSVVYVFLQVLQQAKGSTSKLSLSHLVNFVGMSSNNLLLTLRLIALVSTVSESLSISEKVSSIYRAILEYQVSSYRSELSTIKETVMRVEHNNQLMGIIQSKLTNSMPAKDYHKSCMNSFMKGVVLDKFKDEIHIATEKSDRETKPFYQYSYYIFEYLAFHLHHEGCLGFFPKSIQTAPEPYMPQKKQFTIVMDPVKTLLHLGKEKIFVRAFAQQFLMEMGKKCNIVFWSDQMPNQVDNLFNLVSGEALLKCTKIDTEDKKVPPQIKKLYKHHCFYDYNFDGALGLIKDISRIGCEPSKYIILDTDYDSYYQVDVNKAILIPWKGEAKDRKLATLTDLILPFLREGVDLGKSMTLIKPRIDQIFKCKRKGQRS